MRGNKIFFGNSFFYEIIFRINDFLVEVFRICPVDLNDEFLSGKVDMFRDREAVLVRMESVLFYLQSKALNGRIKESDKYRLQWFKTFLQGCKIFNEIKRDVEIDELNDKIDDMNQNIKMLLEVREVEEKCKED